MKLISKIAAAVSILAVCCIMKPTPAKAQEVSFQVFYDDLSPYGQWVDYPSYGYVWVPAAGPDFVPYSSGGHWVWTDYGWTWVSDYSWGWAPFHYGRWDYDPYYGWLWVPGNEWGPAWVSWRRAEGYYGWAPLGPGISIDVAIGGYNPPADHWVFVNEHYMGRHDINHYYGPRSSNQTYINNSTVINNTYVDNSTHTTYVSGPRREEVQKATGRDIKPVAVKSDTRPGEKMNGNQLNIYRPNVNRAAAEAKPARVATKEEVKPPAERPVMKGNAPAPRSNNAKAPGNDSRTAPRNNQAAPQQRQAPAPGKQPLNAKPASQPRSTNNNAAPRQQRTPAQQQPKQQPVQQQPKQQPIPQQRQPQPQQRQAPAPAPQQRPQPQQQQPHPAPAPQPHRQAPAPAPQPHPMPAPQPRPAPGPGRPH